MSNKEELMKTEKAVELTDKNLEQVSGGVFSMQQLELNSEEMSEELEKFEEIREAMGLNDPDVIKRMAEQSDLPRQLQ